MKAFEFVLAAETEQQTSGAVSEPACLASSPLTLSAFLSSRHSALGTSTCSATRYVGREGRRRLERALRPSPQPQARAPDPQPDITPQLYTQHLTG